jgi:protoheme IX farnesyltransferase
VGEVIVVAMGKTLRQVSDVFKLRIGASIALCAVAGMATTPGASLPSWKIAVLVLAVFLSSAGAGAFNQYAERGLDARMPRTRNRPFVTGVFRAGWAWLTGIGLIVALAVGAAAWALNAHVALYVFLGAFVYGVVYTLWLKRRSVLNIVIGGLAGSFAVLAGAAAITPELAPASIILAVVLFLWTPPHFRSLATAYREDYALAQVPMLPVIVAMPPPRASFWRTRSCWSWCHCCRWRSAWVTSIWPARWPAEDCSSPKASRWSALPAPTRRCRTFMPRWCSWACC